MAGAMQIERTRSRMGRLGRTAASITLAELEDVPKRFAEVTGLGADDFNPCSWMMLPQEFRERVLDIMRLWEDTCDRQVEWAHLIVFIQKRD